MTPGSLTVILLATVMVAQHLDHPAVADLARAAAGDHAGQLVAKPRELRNLALDRLQMGAGDAVGVVARSVRTIGQAEEGFDIPDLEAELSGGG
jgi:hypothetical protein